MKLSTSVILVASTVVSTSAFTAPTNVRTTTSVKMTDSPSDEVPAAIEEPMAAAATELPPAPAGPIMSESLPFMERPMALDGTLAGDVGFDPLGFAKTEEDLMKFREAEIKHGRLAMLAAAGWPISELFDKKIATWLHMAPLVDTNDRAPSLLNGGLGKVSPIYWVACLAFAGAIDVYGITKSKKSDTSYFPGNLGFDPLGLYPKDEAGQMEMQLKEIKNGRLGMIAITAFAVQEFVSQLGVVDETPIFFKPITSVFHEYANSGYIYH